MPFYARASLDDVYTRSRAHVHVKRSRHESSHWLSGPDGQTPGVHPVTRIFLSHGPAAVTRFLSGQSLLISPCSFIVQSPVATKQYVYCSSLPFFLSFFFFLFNFIPILSSSRRIYSSRERIPPREITGTE